MSRTSEGRQRDRDRDLEALEDNLNTWLICTIS